MKKILIGPFTRANNSCSVEIAVENKKVVDSWCSGIFFRGFEQMLMGRDPRDAGYITQRICGICSSAHAMAAALALEAAAGVTPPANGILLRNLILGADFIQSHIRHLYIFSLQDYIKDPKTAPFVPGYTADKRLPPKINESMINNIYRSIEASRLANEVIALLGGKAPFPHAVIAGGSTVPPTADVIASLHSMLKTIRRFIKEVMLPDVHILADIYADYHKIGRRVPNMLNFGLFAQDSQDSVHCFPEGVIIDEKPQKFDPGVIKEHLSRSWYVADSAPQHPADERTVPCREKEGAYSWVKAPRYRGVPLEGGPLARLWLKGDYRRGTGTMDRIICRALESDMIGDLMAGWIDALEPQKPVYTPFDIPQEADGTGMTGSMRGPLGHWLKIEKGRIAHYQIITPTAWNFSPRDDTGRRGPVEEALIGTYLADERQPVEIGRIIRSFDVCSSCSAHVIIPGSPIQQINFLT